MNFNFKIYAVLLFMLGITGYAKAQQNTTVTPASLDLLNQRSLWKGTRNAAGLLLDKPFQYSYLNAGYERYKGNFHRPQQGTAGNRQTVQTEGNLFINRYYLSGSFSYIRDNIKDANYNASIIDPLRGMPYINADLNPSNWNNQHYNLQFSATVPAFNEQWAFGLTGSYKSSSGAKQRDVRSENYFMSLEVLPSVLYSPEENHHIGLNLSYRNFKEEASMSNVNTYIDQTYYELLGLGTAISRVGGGGTNNYEGDAIGGGIQYNYQGDVNVFLTADYNVEAEDLQYSFATPRDGASVLRKVWNTKLSLQKTAGRLSHFADFTYYSRDMDGIQYITQRDNTAAQVGYVTLFKNIRSTYGTQRGGVQYSLVANRDQEYSWKINAGVIYEKLNDEYILPNSVKQAENVLFTLGGKKNFAISEVKAKRLMIGAELGYQSNISGTYNYGGQHADYPTVTGLEQNDFNYLTSNYVSVAVPVVYSQQLKEDSKTNLFVKASGQYVHTNSFDYHDRHSMSFSLGCNF